MRNSSAVSAKMLPGSPLSTECSPDFLAWHFKAFYDLSGTFFCFLYLPYHKSIVPLHVLSSSIALLIMFHLLEILFFFVSTCPTSAHLSKSQVCSIFREAFSDPTQPEAILSNSIKLCTFLGILTTFSFRTFCIMVDFVSPGRLLSGS